MKRWLCLDKDLKDCFMILVIAGLLTGIYCTMHMSSDDFSLCSASLLSKYAIPDDLIQFFIRETLNRSLFLVLIFLLGTSLAGIPLIQFCVFMKGFQIGMICALLVMMHQLKGIMGIFMTLFPSLIFDLMALAVTCSASVELSGTLLVTVNEGIRKKGFASLLNHKMSQVMTGLVISVFSSGLQCTIGLWMMKLFTQLI